MNGLTKFVLFAPSHLAAVTAVAVLAVSIPLLATRLDPARRYRLGTVIALLLLLLEIGKSIIGIYVYDRPLGVSLPLHLCGIAALLISWMLWRRSYAAYEVAYFWGMAGSIPALITPDVAAAYPHPVFFIFFSSHGMILLGVLYATVAYHYRPRLRSIAKTVIVSILLVLVVSPLNLLLDANYMFLRSKPERTTLMDFLGPWPWYVPVLVLIGTGFCLLAYLPFAFADHRQTSHLQ